MIPAIVLAKEGEVLYKDFSLLANQSCYRGAKIGGTVFGDITIVKDERCDECYSSNVHVYISPTGIVVGNISVDEVVVRSGGKVIGKITAKTVTIEPGATVKNIVASRVNRCAYALPPFLEEFNRCTDTTVLALKKLGEKTYN